MRDGNRENEYDQAAIDLAQGAGDLAAWQISKDISSRENDD